MDATSVESVLTNKDLVGLFYLFLSIGITYGITTFIKNKIQQFLARNQIKGCFDISRGDLVRLSISVEPGYVEGKLVECELDKVRIDTKETIIYIPTVEFAKMTWNIVRKEFSNTCD